MLRKQAIVGAPPWCHTIFAKLRAELFGRMKILENQWKLIDYHDNGF